MHREDAERCGAPSPPTTTGGIRTNGLLKKPFRCPLHDKASQRLTLRGPNGPPPCITSQASAWSGLKYPCTRVRCFSVKSSARQATCKKRGWGFVLHPASSVTMRFTLTTWHPRDDPLLLQDARGPSRAWVYLLALHHKKPCTTFCGCAVPREGVAYPPPSHFSVRSQCYPSRWSGKGADTCSPQPVNGLQLRARRHG